MSILYLIRHAHSERTPDENRPLSTQGSMDAARVADTVHKYLIEVIYSSPSRRARETIISLAEQLGLSIYMEPNLQERRLSDGLFEDFFKAVDITWENPTFAHPGGESNVMAQ